MEKSIKILEVHPSRNPVAVEIENELKAMQDIVDGYIETIKLRENVVIVCNEEGKLRSLQPNRVVGNDVIVGTFFICGTKGANFCSLTEEQIKEYQNI